MDIHNLPKEALFSLFLQIEPEEIKTFCLTKNKKVREICNSEYFRETYKQKYRKVDLSYRDDLTEKDFQSLVGVYSVNLFDSDVINDMLKYLSGVHTIDLGYTKVTDEGMKYLTGVHTIDLYNTQVTDEGLKYLSSTGTKKIVRNEK